VRVPTTHPRYSITDTGSTRALLDDAEREWPDVEDRKELLLRLARAGHEALRLDRAEAAARERRELQRSAVSRLRMLVDVDTLLTDQAWR
jgi:hypothetical protein